jgi:aminopeptidase N
MTIRNFLLLVALAATALIHTFCTRSTKSFFHEGVSHDLARYRARHIYDVSYQLHFEIPEHRSETVKGNVRVFFKPLKARHGVVLDFTPGKENVHEIAVNGKETDYMIMNGHIYIDANELIPRQENVIEIAFTASDQALNRREGFMYTLLVPDRASTAFPCFDQPDIKASYQLSLDIPAHWSALGNNPEESVTRNGDRRLVQFTPTPPVSTYLFAFTAGEYDIASETRDGRTIRLFHRETDQQKVELNLPVIFDQHFSALAWLEDYTDIAYPYPKFDMALIPDFQYSGMEHPGAVWYRDQRLLIENDAPKSQIIRRASLIAHETAHMWFGNLVTMQWFDDVWLKEVFAGFMADKIVREQFPDENHELQFLLAHFPRALSVDRSAGTHPIKQKLGNMQYAGTLYGHIIYNKAPIVFEQLEQIMEPERFQKAVREYLKTRKHGNADWDDLAEIFDKHSRHNITKWSEAWIYGRGLPHIAYKRTDGNIRVMHNNNGSSNAFPSQYLGLKVFSEEDTSIEHVLWLSSPVLDVPVNIPEDKPALVLLNGSGKGYGWFLLTEADIQYISLNYHNLKDATVRGVVSINMHENFLQGHATSQDYYSFLMHALEHENNQLLQNYLLDNLSVWAQNFGDYSRNDLYQQQVDKLLWSKVITLPSSSASAFFDMWLKLTRMPESGQKMQAIYKGKLSTGNLQLNDQQKTQLVLETILREPASHDELVKSEMNRIGNPDRKSRFEFILSAVSKIKEDRDGFFSKLTYPAHRNPEPWVIDALYFLHHPLHPEQGLSYIPTSLEMLTEIQLTGDIFFPQNWLNAILQGYSNPEVAAMIDRFLANQRMLSENLKLKLLQSSDIITRSALLSSEPTP